MQRHAPQKGSTAAAQSWRPVYGFSPTVDVDGFLHVRLSTVLWSLFNWDFHFGTRYDGSILKISFFHAVRDDVAGASVVETLSNASGMLRG